MIHQFVRPQGCYPIGDLAVGLDGALYGVTYLGGQATGTGFGTVYRITLQGVHSVLKVFSGAASDTWPYAGLTLGPDGHFYGTTIGGSLNPSGALFRISPQGDYTALSSVVNSQAALTLGADGNFYGTIHQTGASVGAIFRITPGGVLTIIHELPFDPLASTVTCPEGREPMAELVPGPDGNFYSTTRLCGPDPTPGGTYPEGTIFRITPAGALTTLHTFERDPTTFQAPLGASPWAGLTLGSDGHFYGIASSGGTTHNGGIFRITTGGTFTFLRSFDYMDGSGSSEDTPLEVSPGVFYGTTQGGVVYRLNLNPNSPPTAMGSSIQTQQNVAVSGTLTGSDSDGDPLTFTIVTNGARGAAVVTSPSTGAFTYTPNLDATGADSFTFSVSDGTATSNTATVTVTIAPVAPIVYTIRGQVRDRNDTGVPGITLLLTGTTGGTTTTDADGFYRFTVNQGGTYTITPSRPGFVFTPPLQTFTNVIADIEAAFFIASPGVFTRYFAEGATGSFFDTQIALLNATGAPTDATVRFLRADGQVTTVPLSLPGIARATINPETLAGLAGASFSTVVESTQPLIADRTMRWDQSGYGSHAETSIASPLTRWYLAEGATTGGFNLYYLIQNPGTQPAEVEIRYLLPSPAAPVVKTYTVQGNSRRTIYVNAEAPALAESDVSAVLTSTNAVPIIVERAMYLDSNGQLFGAGHASAAVPDVSTSWFFAEGATAPFFNMYILLANPNVSGAEVEARYLLPSGEVVTRSYSVAANARFTISVNDQDARLAATPVSTTLTSTNAVPILAERSMWWPAIPLVTEWQEGHNSAGATRSGEKWGLADGAVGGPSGLQTFVLIANTSPAGGQAQVRVVFEDGTSARLSTPLTLPANSRTTVAIGGVFPQADGRRFGVIVESLGSPAAQIVVERAMYSNAVINGQLVIWAAGTNAVGTRLR